MRKYGGRKYNLAENGKMEWDKTSVDSWEGIKMATGCLILNEYQN